jgi:phosphoribosylformylglycinamidine (FGAM) synthase PurS component
VTILTKVSKRLAHGTARAQGQVLRQLVEHRIRDEFSTKQKIMTEEILRNTTIHTEEILRTTTKHTEETIMTNKTNIMKRICNTGLRVQGIVLRQLVEHRIRDEFSTKQKIMTEEILRNRTIHTEETIITKKTNVMKRICNTGLRVQGQALRELFTHKKVSEVSETSRLKVAQWDSTLREKTVKLIITKMSNYSLTLKSDTLKIFVKNLTQSRHAEDQLIKNRKKIGHYARVICNHGLRIMAQAFRMLRAGGTEDYLAKLHLIEKKISFLKRITDKNHRLLSMAFNKLTEEWKYRRGHAKEKMKFILSGLRKKDHQRVLLAYNSLKERRSQLIGVGYFNKLKIEFRKLQVALRLKDKNYDLMYQAMNAFKQYHKVFILNERQRKLEVDRKLKVVKFIVDQKFRLQGMAFRQLTWVSLKISKREKLLIQQRRAVLTRFGDRSDRMRLEAYRNLTEWSITIKFRLRHRIGHLVKRLRDQTQNHKSQLYYTMKDYRNLQIKLKNQRTVEEGKRLAVLRRLSDSGFRLMAEAWGTLSKNWENSALVAAY